MNFALQLPTPPPPQNSPNKSTQNRIIHGDNLEALKALLPEFENRIDCIYIDPPYNTGNENWVYNDAVNDPRILRWLNKVVGKEGEDFSRHDKWLCMMYPRLKLLHRLLSDRGAIFISIDDHELYNMKLMADEIFGPRNHVATIPAITNLKGRNDKQHVALCHEYVLIYAKPAFKSLGLPLSDEQLSAFKYCDENGNRYALRDLRKRGGPDKRADRPNMHFPLYWNEAAQCIRLQQTSSADLEILPIKSDGSEGRWRWGRDKVEKHLAWLHPKLSTRSGRWGVEHRIYLDPTLSVDDECEDDDEAEASNVVRVAKPKSFWIGGEFSTDVGKRAFKGVLPSMQFDFPKSVDLIKQCLRLGTPKEGIVLDSFAGTGTTAHALLRLNAEDNGNRRFILVEMMDYAESITAERVRRVMDGYGEGDKRVPGLGGSFTFYSVGQHALFDDDGHLNPAVEIDTMRRYLAYTEGLPAEALVDCDNPVGPAYVGSHDGRALLFHYQPHAGTTLDYDFLAGLNFDAATRPERLVVYADYCTLGEDFLARARIVFKKIPRDLTRL